jgi:hypothetical protein
MGERLGMKFRTGCPNKSKYIAENLQLQVIMQNPVLCRVPGLNECFVHPYKGDPDALPLRYQRDINMMMRSPTAAK